MVNKFNTALIIGSGAFGTSIASILSNNFQQVIIKTRCLETYKNLLQGKNEKYLKGSILASNIKGALTFEEVDSLIENKIDLVILGIPTTAITGFLYDNSSKIEEYLKLDIPVVSLSKGIDPTTLELPDDLYFNFFSDYRDNFTFLSGPSFAREIMEEQITLVSLAGRSKRVMNQVSNMMVTDYFKIMNNYDVKGVLLGGALKNILAIAGGIIEGLGYNYNTRAAMITRGIAEMLRFGKVFNARPETFYGLSGMGDLILSTTGDLSRNKNFGLEISKGRTPEEILKGLDYVVEGYRTTQAAYRLSEKYDIRARIFNGVYSVLFEHIDPRIAIKKIMMAPMRFEVE